MFVARRQGWLPVTSAGLSEFCVLSGFFLSPIAEVFFLWEVQITVLLILFHVFKKKKNEMKKQHLYALYMDPSVSALKA